MDRSHPVVRRRDATQATLDKFKDRPFKWGVRDCSRLAAFHLRQMGYAVRLPPSGSYGTLLGATKALKKAGYTSLGDALDRLGLDRIAPAAALAGDIIELPSENSLSSIGVVCGNGRMIGYHEDMAGATILQPIEYVAAWRVEPQ